MKQTIDLTKNRLSNNGWKWCLMGRLKDTVVISCEQKNALENSNEYDEFEKNCTLRGIKIEIIN